MISEKNLIIMAITFASLGLISTTQTDLFAQETPSTTENAAVLSLEDTRTGATYEYVVNSTAQMKDIISKIYKMGSPQGVETSSIADDPTISAIEAIGTNAAAVSDLEDNPDVMGLGSWLKSKIKKAGDWLGTGIKIVKQYGPIVAKVAPFVIP